MDNPSNFIQTQIDNFWHQIYCPDAYIQIGLTYIEVSTKVMSLLSFFRNDLNLPNEKYAGSKVLYNINTENGPYFDYWNQDSFNELYSQLKHKLRYSTAPLQLKSTNPKIQSDYLLLLNHICTTDEMLLILTELNFNFNLESFSFMLEYPNHIIIKNLFPEQIRKIIAVYLIEKIFITKPKEISDNDFFLDPNVNDTCGKIFNMCDIIGYILLDQGKSIKLVKESAECLAYDIGISSIFDFVINSHSIVLSNQLKYDYRQKFPRFNTVVCIDCMLFDKVKGFLMKKIYIIEGREAVVIPVFGHHYFGMVQSPEGEKVGLTKFISVKKEDEDNKIKYNTVTRSSEKLRNMWGHSEYM